MSQINLIVPTVVEDGGRRAVQDGRDEGRRGDATAAATSGGGRRGVKCEGVVGRNAGHCEEMGWHLHQCAVSNYWEGEGY